VQFNRRSLSHCENSTELFDKEFHMWSILNPYTIAMVYSLLGVQCKWKDFKNQSAYDKF